MSDGRADDRTDGDRIDAEAVLASIQAEQDKTLSALRIDARLPYLIWALAWAIGFIGLWLAGRDGSPIPIWAAVLLLVILFALAIAISTRHTLRQVSGVRAGSSWQGMVYGWGWMFGFLVLAALGIRLAMLDLPGAPGLMVLPAVGLLICGLQFLAGAALWGDRSQLVVGAGLLVADGITVFIPTPTNLLVVAVLLGVGFTVCGVLAGRVPK